MPGEFTYDSKSNTRCIQRVCRCNGTIFVTSSDQMPMSPLQQPRGGYENTSNESVIEKANNQNM
jgi:hypothetical protein